MLTIPCKFECLRGTCPFPGIKQKTCQTGIQVRKKIKARLSSHNNKTGALGLLPLEKEDIEQVFISSANNGFACPWCERPLDLWAKAELWSLARAASIDHLIPLRSGKSTNHVTNLLLCCHQCNTVKGQTDPVYWRTFVNNTKKEHGLQGLWKYLDTAYPQASAREINANWWGKKKEHQDVITG
jgi:hypothetical protein